MGKEMCLDLLITICRGQTLFTVAELRFKIKAKTKKYLQNKI